MPDLDQQIKDKLFSKDSASIKLRDLFQMAYKQGPIRREIVFKAESAEDARRIAERYVRHMNRIENSKSVLVGIPKPFARDLELDVSNWEEKNGQQKLSA